MTRSITAMALCAGAMVACSAPAFAQTHVLASSGLWSTYGGTVGDNRSVCGLTTVGPDGRRINVQQFGGESGIELELQKDSWAIPPSTPLDLRIQFDRSEPLPARATGRGRQVDVRMSFDESIPFMRALRNGQQIRILFVSGNEGVWTGGLAGSGRAIDAFNECRAQTISTTPTQPFAQPDPTPKAAPVPEGPTQPFSPTTGSATPGEPPSGLPPLPLATGVPPRS